MYASEFFVFGLGLIFCFNLCFGCEDAAKSLCVVEFINCIETASEKDQICTCFGHEYGCMKKIHCDVAAFPTTCKNAGCTFVQCNPLSAISPALESAVKKTSNAIQWKNTWMLFIGLFVGILIFYCWRKRKIHLMISNLQKKFRVFVGEDHNRTN